MLIMQLSFSFQQGAVCGDLIARTGYRRLAPHTGLGLFHTSINKQNIKIINITFKLLR